MAYKLTQLVPFGVLLEPEGQHTHIRSLDTAQIRTLFHQHHLVLLRGFETFDTADDFADYCDNWGEVSLWPFGKVLELVEQDKPEDHIFDSSYMPMHWDGMYRPQVPEYQLFHCVKAPLPDHGGKTTFSNTMLALEYASAEDIALWKQVTGVYQRKMEFYNSKTVSPIITEHPLSGYPVIRYNEPHDELLGQFVNPPDMTFTGVSDELLGRFHQSLKQALYDPRNFYAHEWQTGDIAIADNFSLLHGREAFTSHSPRHIRRVQVLSNPPFDNPSLESYQWPQQ